MMALREPVKFCGVAVCSHDNESVEHPCSLEPRHDGYCVFRCTETGEEWSFCSAAVYPPED